MNSIFVVAAGGTGAKVVESLIHLCAAGIGPDRLDVLLLDVDKANGNMARTRETAELYVKLRTWDWTLSPRPASKNGNSPLAGTSLFKTSVEIHECLDAISTVGNGGLQVHLRNTPGADKLLDLLYSKDEQESKCEKGFLARPNLGSLVLGGHLREKLKSGEGGTGTFKARLFNELNGATPQRPIPLMVVGSIFGGTGSSLFPIACQCIKEAVRSAQIAGEENPNWKKLAPVAVMLTPYFLPEGAKHDQARDGETVDASRFLADTANTLKHYVNPAVLAEFKAVYLIGSDQHQSNRLKFADGAGDQSNPPFIEEIIAALAVLDAGERPDDPNERRRIYVPPASNIKWTDLPFPIQGTERLALLLELAAFVLLQAKDGRELSGGLLQACSAWSGEFELLPWYKTLLGRWVDDNFSHDYDRSRPLGKGWQQLADANVLPGNAAASKAKDFLAEYAYRLLLWTRTTLPDVDPYRLVKMGAEMDYALVWEVMCGLTPAEIEPAARAKGKNDNALVRVARAAAVALAKIATGQHPRHGLVNNKEQALPGFPGRADADGGACSLPIAQNTLQDIGEGHGISAAVHAKFVKTEVTETWHH